MSGPRRSVLGRVQGGLEELYRIDTQLDVDSFVVDEAGRDAMLAPGSAVNREPGSGTSRRPREQLLVAHDRDELHLALFLDSGAIDNLERNDPAEGLSHRNFDDFCLAVEGVSHFVYVARCAQSARSTTALELELQAEIDTFVSCVLLNDAHPERASELRHQLFDEVSFAADLDATERARYEAASWHARRYAASLDRRYLQCGRATDMLGELRWFYRLDLDGKLGFIAG